MRLLRLHLRNFKGVADTEVHFDPQGVTIVEGPNEVGKTSIVEALTLVLDHLDSSSRSEIRDAKPVHRDAGPWVEAELITGAYHLIIEKRWLRSPMTHLRVLAPRAEELTGREAHERLRAILDETLDQQLFRALHYLQGVDIAQASVGDSMSLAAALDASASGQSPALHADAGLVERIRDERGRYFTPGGRPTQERQQREAELIGVRAEADQLALAIAELDRLADRYRSLSAEGQRLAAARTANAAQLTAETAAWQTVQEARRAVAETAARHETARLATAEAQRRLEARTEQLRAEEDAAARHRVAAEGVAAVRPAADAAERAFTEAAAHRAATHTRRAAAAESLAAARDDHEYARRLVSRDLWRERLGRVRAGQQALASTAEIIASNHVDADRLGRLEAAAATVTETRARLSAASAGVSVAAHAPTSVRIGAVAHDLAAGEAVAARVDGTLVVRIGDLASVTITGGAPERSLRQSADDAETAFRALLADCGLPEAATIAECRLAAERRRDALADRGRAERLIAESLRDLSVERLEQEVADDEEYLRGYERRHGVPAAPPAIDDAQARLRSATATHDAAAAEDEAAGVAHDAARGGREAAQAEATNADTAREVAAAVHAHAREALDLARAREGDAALDAAMRCAREAESDAGAAAQAATLTLAGLDPDSVEARRINLEALAARLEGDAAANQRELVETRTTLGIRGDEGLHDRHEQLESRYQRLLADHERIERAAAAADLLWARVEAHRDAAQRSYVAPFRAEIERLGRIVYGPSFAVEIDHATLAVASRTLNDRTVAFGLLSSGAREQLCVLTLLACAGLVTADGRDGVPVLIDDALGWTDRDRLERLGAAFASAGRGAQVIVLTCDPDRYRTVGSATVRRLRPAAGGRTPG